MSVKIESLSGAALDRALPDLARLRIEVFRAFPYLYDGSDENEQHYLRSYKNKARAVLVAAISDGKIIGAATAMPLAEHGDASQLHGDAVDIDDVFYCAESVLLPEYRGQGIGHAFFDHRENFARQHGFGTSAFCSVIRPPSHPMRPAGYRPLDAFWGKRGYAPMPGVTARFSWVDVEDTQESTKTLQFWARKL